MAPGLSISAARSRLIGIAAFTALLAFVAPARAAYSCTVTVNDLAFGLYSVLNSIDTDSTADITVDCSGSDNTKINATTEISAGSSGSFNPRTMLNGASALNYNIYTKSNHNQIWGDGSGGSVTQTISCSLKGPPTTCSTPKTLYGRIPIGQSVPAGSYTDMLIVTITF